MKNLLIAVTCLFLAPFIQAQSVAKLKYEQAEEAYNKGEYAATITYLDEVEKLLKSSNSKILYLRIMSQDKLFSANPYDDYALLKSLRSNCDSYLKTNENNVSMEDKFKEVYFVSDKLTPYPTSETAFNKKRDEIVAQENARIAEQEAQIKLENDRIQAEANRLAEIEELARQKRMRNVGFFAFRIGGNIAANSESKALISYQTWLNEPGLIAVPFQKGQFNYIGGGKIGFSGIASLNGINKNLPENVGLGLSYDFNQTVMAFDWNKLADGNTGTAWFFNDAKYIPFGISSMGLGLSLTAHSSRSSTFFDVFFRPDINFIYGGSYKLDTYSNGADIICVAKRDKMKIKVGPTIGMNFRKDNFYAGFEFRLGLIDDSGYSETYSANYGSGAVEAPVYIIKTGGLNLNYVSISIGSVLSQY